MAALGKTSILPLATTSLQAKTFLIHEELLENGTTVREYTTPAGLVFAVSWQGPVLPDLKTLLGSYFRTLQTETEHTVAKGNRGSPVNMTRDGLVIKSNGRMRNFFGQAYVPDLLPTGMNIKDVLP